MNGQNQTPEATTVSEILVEHGITFKPGDTDKILQVAAAAGVGGSDVCQFIHESATRKSQAGDPVRSAALLLRNLLIEDLGSWARRRLRSNSPAAPIDDDFMARQSGAAEQAARQLLADTDASESDKELARSILPGSPKIGPRRASEAQIGGDDLAGVLRVLGA